MQGIIRGMLETVARLALAGAGSAMRDWLARHEATLHEEPAATLDRAALDALAMAPIALKTPPSAPSLAVIPAPPIDSPPAG